VIRRRQREEPLPTGGSWNTVRHSRVAVNPCIIDKPNSLDETVKVVKLEGVDTAGLILTAVGTVAGVFGAYFAWIAVRRARPRVKKTALGKPTPGRHPGEESSTAHAYDVFVSYSRDDRDWVASFTGRLEAAGLRVARDEVFLRPGDVLVHAIEQAILESAHGILVFSQASVADGWVSQQYATMMQKTIEDGRRFIPVLIDDVELPVFAATRYYVDFRSVSLGDYDRLTAKIVDALRGRGRSQGSGREVTRSATHHRLGQGNHSSEPPPMAPSS